MPRATKVLVEFFREEKPIGLHGWTLRIDRVLSVGITYRARLTSPDGANNFSCPTRFRHVKNCYTWAMKQVKLQNKDAMGRSR